MSKRSLQSPPIPHGSGFTLVSGVVPPPPRDLVAEEVFPPPWCPAYPSLPVASSEEQSSSWARGAGARSALQCHRN